MAADYDIDDIWKILIDHQETVYRTSGGLEFTYTISGGEMFVDRKKKSITRASVKLALDAARELNYQVKGPKKLKVFGASYLYPVFMEQGIIQGKESRKSDKDR